MNALFGMYGKTFDETLERLGCDYYNTWYVKYYSHEWQCLGFWKCIEYVMDNATEIHFQTAGLCPLKSGVTRGELQMVLRNPDRLAKTTFWKGKRQVKTKTILTRYKNLL